VRLAGLPSAPARFRADQVPRLVDVGGGAGTGDRAERRGGAGDAGQVAAVAHFLGVDPPAAGVGVDIAVIVRGQALRR
jgi:hypothetical protein